MFDASLVVLMLSLLGGCAMYGRERLLAVGGMHELAAGREPCHLTRVEPASALEDRGGEPPLVLRARGEGHAEVACGDQRVRLLVVTPERLELELVGDHVVVGKPFVVQATPIDHAGRELEIGKWTELQWHSAPTIEVERSTGAEFGFCDTCFGIQTFRTSVTTPATIEARLGNATGTLRVIARP
jgi:hypothetical protein